jgi:hypothetical protein
MMRCRIGCVADEALGTHRLRRARADRRRVGHQLRHLGAGAVAGIHREEAGARQGEAHRARVPGSDAGRAELLQENGFGLGERGEAARHVEQRFAGADFVSLGVERLDRHRPAAHGAEPVERRPRGHQHGAAEEDGVGDRDVAVAFDDRARAAEIRVRAPGDLGLAGQGRVHRRCRPRYSAATRRRSGGTRRSFSSAATRKASSRLCSAFSRGSQKVW